MQSEITRKDVMVPTAYPIYIYCLYFDRHLFRRFEVGNKKLKDLALFDLTYS